MKFILNRPMIIIFLYFAGGIVSAYYLKLNILLIIFLFIIVISHYKFTNKKFVFFILFIFILGSSLISYEEFKYSSSHSITNWKNKDDLYIIGIIREDLKNLCGNKVYLEPVFVNGKEIKYGKIELDKRYLTSTVQEGEIYRGNFSLREPCGKENPGAFSYKKYLKRKGIYSLGYLESNFSLLAKKNLGVKNILVTIKKNIINTINKKIDKPYNEIIKALLLGERTQLPENWEEKFSLSGANHLLAISGLHIGFILLILLKITEFTNRNNKITKNICISLILIIYILLTGLRASVFRAGFLAIFYLWGKYFNREVDIFNILGITACINLLINPYALFEVGFQLTYLVLIMILLWQPYLKKIFPDVLSVSISAQLGSIVLTSYYFNLITPIGIITNLWAIPLTGFIIIISLITLIIGMILPFFFKIIEELIKILLIILYKGMEFTSSFSWGYFEIATPKVWVVFFMYIILFLFPFIFKKRSIPVLKKKNYIQRKVFIIFLVMILFINFYNSSQNYFEITFFSVGQGDSILLKLPTGETILIDGGGMAGENSNQGEVVILPYLKHKGIKKIDLAVITHFDTDHALGINYLLEKNRINSILVPCGHSQNYLAKNAYKFAKNNNVKIFRAQRGDIIKKGKVTLTIIHPFLKNDYITENRNNNSIVIKVIYHNFSVLLTGDLEKEGEIKLIESGDDLNTQILKIAHHGSNSSTSKKFLEKVSAREAIVSVGENNYGHPSQEVISRINKYGIRKWITQEVGAVIIKTDGFSYSIKSFIK